MQASLATAESLRDQKIIVQQVFETMANLPLTECANHVPYQTPAIASLLEFSEPSAGAMVIDCSAGLASIFTARLMSIAPPDCVNEDVRDAMCELVNMVGGNLKGLMPEDTCVSIPRLLTPAAAHERASEADRLSRICFSFGEEHCCISLFEGRAAAARA